MQQDSLANLCRYLLKSSSPRIVPAIHTELDLSSVCVITLIRGLGLLHPKDTPVDLVRIVRGSHRLLPYALEFWIEHCSNYASQEGYLGVANPLSRHLTRLHNTHEDASNHLNRLENSCAPNEPLNSEGDDQLKAFSHMPIHEIMKGVLHVRRLTGQRRCENGRGACTLRSMPKG